MFTRLYQQHAPALLTHLVIHLPSRMDAEDMLVDVFVVALEQQALLMTLSLEEQRLWLWRVARNRQVDYYRRASRRQAVALNEVVETLYEDDEQRPENIVLQHEEYHKLQRHFKRLPQLQQEVLRLRFVNGFRSNEIAQLLGKNDGAIRTLISRSLNLLREIYSREKEE
ncbi:RNA polymerase sigma factor [Reticulibacter mediterranei]|uniref:RNA polymerase sigma factor n=1 Tax=Reticulibacter mediterranei TaxID=2778369 RepID=UPI001F48A259|nr:RNA polymerase sigma factor [Reticulibacter mediterranei]